MWAAQSDFFPKIIQGGWKSNRVEKFDKHYLGQVIKVNVNNDKSHVPLADSLCGLLPQTHKLHLIMRKRAVKFQ